MDYGWCQALTPKLMTLDCKNATEMGFLNLASFVVLFGLVVVLCLIIHKTKRKSHLSFERMKLIQ